MLSTRTKSEFPPSSKPSVRTDFLSKVPKEVSKSTQGLEGYSRNLGFDQNTVRDSGKHKIRSELTKYLDGNRDLTALWEEGFAKIWARDAGFFVCLSGIREIVTTQINVLAA